MLVSVYSTFPHIRDPEFVLYDGLQRKMSASMVRSAVFDLYLSIMVAGYVTALYFTVLVSTLYQLMLSLASQRLIILIALRNSLSSVRW